MSVPNSPSRWGALISYLEQKAYVLECCDSTNTDTEARVIRRWINELASSETERWISVEAEKPHCPRGSMAFGTPVLIWPRNPGDGGAYGFAYYGKRATGKPAFYLHGAELHGVTHWKPMPAGPERGQSSNG